MIYSGSYLFLYKNIIEKIKKIRENDKISKISFIIFSNSMRRALKQYITDELGILYNIEFFTKIDIANKLVQEKIISNLEKKLLIKIILDDKYTKGVEKSYLEIFQSIKEEKLNQNSIPEEIRNIFNKYNSNLAEYNLKDREDIIIDASKYNFKSDYIFIFGFQSLSLIDRELLKKIIENNDKNKIDILLPIDTKSSIYKNNKYLEIYINFFKNLGFKEEKEEDINKNIELTRLINSKEIRDNGINSANINFLEVKGKKQEIDYLAKNILYLREDKNIEWNKIGVIINDIESYISNIKEIFSDYHIPYYLSKENRYIDNINFKKIFSLLSLKLNNFSRNELLNSISSNLINLENIDIVELEKLLVLNSFEEGFDNLEKFLIKDLLDILIDLNSINNEGDLNYFIEKFEEFIEKYLRDNLYKQKYLEIIDKIKEGNFFSIYTEKIKLKDFNHILITHLEEENKDNRKTGNNIVVSTPAIALSLKFEHLFFIDLNDGKYPLIKDDNILLNKYDDLKKLISKKYIIYSQQILTFINLFNSSKNNYLFFKKINDEGNEVTPSILIEELLIYQFGISSKEENFFISIPKKETMNEFKLKNSKKLINNDFLEKVVKMNSVLENKDFSIYEGSLVENKSIMYQDKSFSPSKLKRYIECPYKFFIKDIIKADNEIIFNLEKIPYDKEGQIIHSILEEVFKNYKKGIINFKELIKERFQEKFTPLINELKKSSKKFETIRLNQLEYNIIDFVKNNIEEIKDKYQVELLEYSGNIELQEYRINGIIDRVDKNINENTYNIYDYKVSRNRYEAKSKKEDDLQRKKELIEGNHIQLYIYKRILEKEGKEIDKLGIFYLRELGVKVKQIMDSEAIMEAETFIDNAIRKIKENIFYPDVENKSCEYCEYAYICGKKSRDEELKIKKLNDEN